MFKAKYDEPISFQQNEAHKMTQQQCLNAENLARSS